MPTRLANAEPRPASTALPLRHDGHQMLRWLRRLVIGLFGAGLVLLLLGAVVAVPPMLIDTSGIADPAKRLDEVNAFRTTLAGVLGGLAVAGGAVVAALNFQETSRQNRAVLELQRRGQVTERFTKAIEQVGQPGPDKLALRLGGIYALEQIALDSEDMHWPVMEVLVAFVHTNPAGDEPPVSGTWADDTPRRQRDRLPIPADLQAAVTVLGRRPESRRRWEHTHERAFNLRFVDLRRARLWGAHFEDTLLTGARFDDALLVHAHLQRAYLSGASLRGVSLRDAHLEQAVLRGAHLEGATLLGARMDGADLRGAHLERTDITRAQLETTLFDNTTVLPLDAPPAPAPLAR